MCVWQSGCVRAAAVNYGEVEDSICNFHNTTSRWRQSANPNPQLLLTTVVFVFLVYFFEIIRKLYSILNTHQNCTKFNKINRIHSDRANSGTLSALANDVIVKKKKSSFVVRAKSSILLIYVCMKEDFSSG